jgi:hypothetical protein
MRELGEEYRPVAEGIVARHPAVTPQQLAVAEATMKAARPRNEPASGRSQMNLTEVRGIVVTVVTAGTTLLVVLCSLLSAFVTRGGIVSRTLGLAIVSHTGEEIGRGRAALRVLVAWAPALVWLAYLAVSPKIQGFVPVPVSPIFAIGLALGVMAVGAAWTIARRTRGPHDWIVGTWVVPR